MSMRLITLEWDGTTECIGGDDAAAGRYVSIQGEPITAASDSWQIAEAWAAAYQERLHGECWTDRRVRVLSVEHDGKYIHVMIELVREASRHTPGPWRISPYNPHNILATRDGEKKLVGSVYHVEGINSLEHAETHGNAVLMASAPELLASLKEVTRELAQMHEWAYPGCKNEGPSSCPAWAAIEAARALIARTEAKEECNA